MTARKLPVIITRAEPGASETAGRLAAFGIDPILAPMLSLEPDLECAIPDLSTRSGLVFTSANGVRVFADRDPNRSLTAWCVGPATAKAAREAGFEQVRESAGNAVDLAHFIAEHVEGSERPLLHIANADAKGDLKTQLEALGHALDFAPRYAMRPAPALPHSAQQALQSADNTVVMIHSAKGATRLADLCAGLSLTKLVVVAISEPASQPLSNLPLTALHVASAPNEDSLMSALSAAIATLSA